MTREFAALLMALAGLVFSVLSALGLTDAVCVTDGCSLFRGTTVLGIDLYWFGAFFFGVTAALIASQVSRREPLRRRRPSSLLVLWLSGGLVVSALLLGIQALTTPCLSCLIVAGLLGGTALLLLPGAKMLAWPLLIWALVLVAALSGLARQQFEPVPVFGGPEATVRVFFAPSCPSCLKELHELAGREEIHPRLALYPLALREADLPVISRFRQELASSGSLAAAVDTLSDPAPEAPAFRELLEIRLLSFRNRAFLAGIGARTVPYLLTSTPSLLAPPPPAPPGDDGDPAPSQPPAAIPIDEGCEYDRVEELCEEEEPTAPFSLDRLQPPRPAFF